MMLRGLHWHLRTGQDSVHDPSAFRSSSGGENSEDDPVLRSPQMHLQLLLVLFTLPLVFYNLGSKMPLNSTDWLPDIVITKIPNPYILNMELMKLKSLTQI